MLTLVIAPGSSSDGKSAVGLSAEAYNKLREASELLKAKDVDAIMTRFV